MLIQKQRKILFINYFLILFVSNFLIRNLIFLAWGTVYKSDLEDKLQTYNKINGAIRRYFGKETNKETKLIIHNITAKAALKFGSEAWVLKKRE